MPDTPNQPFYLTTPIYYVNARPHIGHAYTTIVADVLARRHRLLGDNVFFLTGTDEHGQKIERSAAAAGIPPQQFADNISAEFRNLWARMGITHDAFIRTTSPQHIRGAQKLFADLHARGQIYLSSYTGQYSIGEEMFVEGPPGTLGPDGRPTETVTEENFFFRLSDFQLPLLNLIESNQLQITPDSTRNEVLSFLRGNSIDREKWPELWKQQPDGTFVTDNVLMKKHIELRIADGSLAKSDRGNVYVPGALRDLSVSRSSFTWGIPVPEPAASETQQKHVIYVWLDALANYMTALGYGTPDDSLWQKFWPADLHLVGKEITRFHCVYWPAFLLAAGLPLPKAVTAHGWLLFDNSKMSKSKGNIVRTETILDAFGTLCPPSPPKDIVILSAAKDLLSPDAPIHPTPHDRDLFAADVLRYYLLREIPFGQDGSFSFEALITRYNADLAKGYGNLVRRTLSMIQEYLDGRIPAAPPNQTLSEMLENLDRELTELLAGLGLQQKYDFNDVRALVESLSPLTSVFLDSLDFSTALKTVATMVSTVDRMLTAIAPWKIDRGEVLGGGVVAHTLHVAAESIRIITALLHPILPYATARVWSQLGLGDIELAARNGDLKNLTWGGLQPGTKLGPLSPIFPRAPKELAQLMTDMEDQATPATRDPQPETRTQNPSPEPPPPATAPPTTDNPQPTTSTTDPAAGPRTAPEPTGTLPVGGSTAHTTGPDPTPLTNNQQPTTNNQIAIDDFLKIELRVAQILVAERIPKADKLLRLEVDLGPDLGHRQILSGIAEHYTPEDLLGRRIIVITNLAPRKMRGLESHGMLLAGSATDTTKPILATMADDIPLGTRLK